MHYLLALIQNKLGPEALEIAKWKTQVGFLVKTLTNEKNKCDWLESALTKEQKELKKL